MSEAIVRIAARGEGVTAGGRHIGFAVPGDVVHDNGEVEWGPHHQAPPCRHFPECGGCQLQHADDAAYRAYLVSRVEGALAQHDLATEIRDPHLSPPRSRRRASLRGLKVGSRAVLGFNAQRSHQIVDMRECHILRPELFALVAPLRDLLGGLLRPRRPCEVQLALTDQGVDVMLKGAEVDGLAATEALTGFCIKQGLARLTLDQGLGAEAAVVLDPPRAGAVEQVAGLAASPVPRIAYVSCNPATFARDAKTLVAGGYALDWVRPVGQFRWSTHVELAAAFSR